MRFQGIKRNKQGLVVEKNCQTDSLPLGEASMNGLDFIHFYSLYPVLVFKMVKITLNTE